MNNKKPVDLSQVKSSNLITRSKKFPPPPPPLCLPDANTTIDEDKLSTLNQQCEQKTSINNYCLSSSSKSKECLHEHIPYVSWKKRVFFFYFTISI